MKRYSSLWGLGAVLLTAWGVSACGTTPSTTATLPHPAIRLTDDLGQVVTLKKPATRIVAIEPSNAEIVLDLGLRHDLVGVDESVLQYTPAPWTTKVRGLPSIGSAYPGLSLEKVVAKKPNLVIADDGVKGLSALKRFHIPVLVLNPTSIQGVYHDIQLVGKATATTTQAARVVHTMQQQIAALSPKVASRPHRPTVFYDLGGLYTAGPHSFVNALINLAGGKNVGATLSPLAYPKVTAEQVVKADPDEILIDSSSGTSVSQEDHLAGFAATHAVKTGHVYKVPDTSYIDQPSPGLVTGLKILIHLIHPHLHVGS